PRPRRHPLSCPTRRSSDLPLLFVFAVVLYLIVRPRETLAEVYERSLAEESLLAEVEKNELCPVCRDRVDSEWLVCPNCRTRLHRARKSTRLNSSHVQRSYS